MTHVRVQFESDSDLNLFQLKAMIKAIIYAEMNRDNKSKASSSTTSQKMHLLLFFFLYFFGSFVSGTELYSIIFCLTKVKVHWYHQQQKGKMYIKVLTLFHIFIQTHSYIIQVKTDCRNLRRLTHILIGGRWARITFRFKIFISTKVWSAGALKCVVVVFLFFILTKNV